TLFIVERRWWIEKDGKWMRNPSREFLTREDAFAIRNQCPSVKQVIPEIMGDAHSQVGRESRTYMMEATEPEFPESQNWALDFGRFLTNDDMSSWRKVCVIGAKVWEEMFNKINPLGREIRINNETFTVIGVMEEKGRIFNDFDRDRQVLVPLTTIQRRFRGNDYVDIFWCKAKSFEVADQAVEETKTVLRRRHNDEEFFEIHSVKSALDEINKVVMIIKVMLGGTATIALIVGGVGIMNIMLVSVTERTREIGLRKAIGAKRRDILLQFLVESVFLCIVGGAIGILAGFGIGIGLARIITIVIIRDVTWPATISLNSLLMAVGSASAIGMLFGLYPAGKAAKLQPVEALRYE
ncbi:FtsX-like permease family protein, partial [Candidatus Poribacteria bacterium]|nr:FtsX-like permease family protein [Candidatus Poribacteria bacterium]